MREIRCAPYTAQPRPGPRHSLGAYGFVATFQPDPHFGRILATYGGVFVAGSLAWGMIFDGFRPDRWDIAGSLICLLGVAVIMFAPRPGA
ncbi:YnfA family protein [Pseudarthrobacter oxydans]|uniref:YnfA family protein n=1 Tax=Pseudarthrobacter oxydans TaxID=1671 RepID=UPI00382A4CFB